MADGRPSTGGYDFPRTIRVSHLGGIEVGYRIAGPYKQYKPTLILVNSFMTSVELYSPQFANTAITEAMNLIAIEPLGHGRTELRSGGKGNPSGLQTFTYWDTAVMILQVMDALGVKKAFALGTSQGGWIVTRLALLAPDRILGILPLGTSHDYESERSRKLGCWDAWKIVTDLVDNASAATGPTVDDYAPPDDFCNLLIDVGFGRETTEEMRKKWHETMKSTYKGEAGRRRLRECAVNLRERDGLHGRLANVQCPVLWLHGDKDEVYTVANAQEEIKMFTSSPSAELVVVPGGHHFLSTKEVDEAVLRFVAKHSKGATGDARAMREAVGMVEM